MAKRFIDTELFLDEWFNELSKDTKLFFIYYITRCDHAGVLRLNNKLLEFQTGIKSSQTVIKELGNCLVTVKEGVYFMPKFIKFQYPKFPQSTVKQQEGAIKILDSLGLWDDKLKTYQTVTKELNNSYVNDSVSEDNKEPIEKIKYYRSFAHLSMTVEEYEKLISEGWTKKEIDFTIDKIENYKKNTAYKSLIMTCRNWLKENNSKGDVIVKGEVINQEYEYLDDYDKRWKTQDVYRKSTGENPNDSIPKRLKK